MYRFVLLCFLGATGFGCAPQGTETGDDTASDIVVGQERDEVHLGRGTLPQIVGDRENTQMLNDALRATHLDEELTQGGPYTLFAPTDDAFESLALGINNVSDSTQAEELRQILLHHVVEGKYSATELAQMKELTTLGGNSLQVGTSSDNVTVDGADVVLSDQEADNGYVHLIDSVLVPS